MVTHLVVPGLLGPLPSWGKAGKFPRFPVLERLLARADKAEGPQDYAQALFAVFGLAVPGKSDLPTAALCWLADTGRPPPGCLLHADPVNLHPDMDRILLFGVDDSTISEQEAASFVDAFNAHFAPDGLTLHAPHPARWYLSAVTGPQINTRPLSETLGRSIEPFLPTGPQAMEWHKLFTEVQMLFHGLPVNREREARGVQPINGLWFSGVGELPAPVEPQITGVTGEGCLLNGIGRLTGMPVGDRVASESPVSGRENVRVIVLRHPFQAVLQADPNGWLAALEEVEQQLRKLLERGESIELYPCNGWKLNWRPGMRWRVWRRSQPVERHLEESRLPD